MIRDLLAFLENHFDGTGYIDNNSIAIDGYSNEQISYHLGLLHDAGFIKAKETMQINDPSYWAIFRITWDGHEFIEAARSNSRWNKAKEVMNKSGGFAFDVLKSVLVKILEDQAMSHLA